MAFGQESDLGSWVCKSVDNDEIYGTLQFREYYGLSTDIDKLPTGAYLATGSTAYCVDTGNLYMYNAETKLWVEQ